MKAIKKRLGTKTEATVAVLGQEDVLSEVTDWIPTGFPDLDRVLGGGWAVGRASEVYGDEGCLIGATTIKYQIRTPEGKIVNSKGGTLARLYERFHRIRVEGKGKNRAVPDGAEFYAPSFTEDGFVMQNRIRDVKKNGKKAVFLLRTKSKDAIQATADHEFFVGDGYVALARIKPGDTVMLSVGERFRGTRGAAPKTKRKYLYVKAHPVAGVKLVDGKYRYHRLARARAVVEADMNGLDLADYMDRLNACELEGLTFLPRDQNVHHLDEDVANDARENLAVKDHAEHVRDHAHENHENLRFILTPTEVVSVEKVGERMTYDLVMDEPYRCYVAGNFAVHNCGKTALGHRGLREVQNMGGLGVLLDFERALDKKKMVGQGIDPDKLIYVAPDNAEEGWETVFAIVDQLKIDQPDAPTLIVWDSIAAAVPKAEREGKMEDMSVGLHARIMTRGCNRMFSEISKVRAHMMWINQNRSKIGGFSGWGGPQTDTTGGRAVKFAASQRVANKVVKRLKASAKAGSEPTGYLVKTITDKCRLAPPHRSTEWVLDFTVGPSPDLTMRHLLTEAGVLKKGKGPGRLKAPWSEDPFRKAAWLQELRDVSFRRGARAAFQGVIDAGGARKYAESNRVRDDSEEEDDDS